MQLGPYEIIEEIGRGGMAVVYRAYQPSLHRYVAIKVLPPQLSFDQQFVERFQREARAAAGLRHPNIVVIHDVGHQEGIHFIVMEYLEGRTLKQLVEQEGPPPLARAARILDQVAAALDYAHQRGFIHRDIKPANIFVNEGDLVTLTDFGIAKAAWETQQLTRTGMLIGTPEYMSPEQAEGRMIDYRTDLYALGVVLYQMLTGAVPFRGTTPHGILHAVIYEPPPPPRQLNPGITPAVETVLLKALAKQPQERFHSGRSLAGALRLAQAGSAVQVPATSRRPASPAASARQPTRYLMAAIVSIVLLLGGLMGWFLWRSITEAPAGSTALAQAATGTALAIWDQALTRTAISDDQTQAMATPLHTTGSALTATAAEQVRRSATETTATLTQEQRTITAEAERQAATATAAVRRTEEAMAATQAALVATQESIGATQTAAAQPTATPIPRPTDTPPPPPIPTPTAIPPTSTPSCPLTPYWPFDAMGDAPRLGCPTGPSSSTHYSHQFFEGGQMIYRHDLRRIYVLYYADNTWEYYPDTYNEGEPWQLNEYDPPPGLQQPIKGFDRVWENYEQVRNRIGWAQRGEVGLIDGNYEDFEMGTALWLSHEGYLTAYYLLFSDAAWEQR